MLRKKLHPKQYKKGEWKSPKKGQKDDLFDKVQNSILFLYFFEKVLKRQF